MRQPRRAPPRWTLSGELLFQVRHRPGTSQGSRARPRAPGTYARGLASAARAPVAVGACPKIVMPTESGRYFSCVRVVRASRLAEGTLFDLFFTGTREKIFTSLRSSHVRLHFCER